MPLSKLKFNPGINRDLTDYTNTGGWFDSDKIRFRNGLPEKIGGWQKFLNTQFLGTARDILRWSSLNGTIYTSIATNEKVYVNGGSLPGYQDMTPLRATATLTNPFTTTNSAVATTGASGTGATATITFAEQPFAQTVGTTVTVSGVTPSGYNGTYTVTASSTTSVSYANATTAAQTVAGTVTIGSKIVTVTDSAHGCIEGDFVTFSGSGAVGGVPAADFNKEHEVTHVIDNNRYEIVVATTATSGATGGGTVTAAYQINIGLDSLVVGTGWGAGPFGGANSPASSLTVTSGNIASTNGSANIVITYNTHGLLAGDSVVLSGLTTAIGGIDVKFINRAFTVVSVATNTITVTTQKTASSSATSSEAATMLTYISTANSGVSTGWGTAATESSLRLQLRLWSLDNFGEDLLMNPRDGGIYLWSESTPTQRALNIVDIGGATDCPTIASKVLVSDIGQHTLAFGADPFGGGAQDKMLIRWSTDQSYLNWDEADTAENAGSLRISNGSFIVTAEQTRQEVLVWTDTALYSLQYQGGTYIFTASLISSGTDIIGPNSVATAVNTSFWMGSDNFYYYDGSVNRMPCTVREKVFLDLNFEQRYKVYAGINSENNEITWFYPSANSTENNRYVTYNYAEKAWYYGEMARTTWIDRGFGANPLSTSSDNYAYNHEVGTDDGSTNPPSPIVAYIESSPVEIEDGDKIAFVSRIIPDISFRNTGNFNPARSVNFAIKPQMYPGAAKGASDSNAVTYNYSVDGFTEQLFTRIRGRSVILRVSSDEVGVAWRLGTPRFDIRLDGRR